MSDTALVRELLHQILWSTETITKSFAPIASPDDFTGSDEGLEAGCHLYAVDRSR
jgi:hypothetical protein